jgi:hypothetical protein
MIEDQIIDELHDIREKLVNESRAKGMSLTEYFKSKGIPEGFKKSDLKPAKLNKDKLKKLMVYSV